jgi:PAS domain S-box-containing protein
MQNELRYAVTVAAALDAIVVIDEDQKIILFNEHAEKLFGYRQNDIVGQPLELLLPIGGRERHSQHVNHFIDGRQRGRLMAERQTVQGRHANGQLFTVEASISQTQVRDRHYCTVVLRDVSPIRRAETLLRDKSDELEQYLKQYENELNLTRSRLSEVQRLTQTGIWDLDLKNNILYWSDEVYEIFEIDKSRFGASYDAFLDAIYPTDRNMVDEAYRNSLETRKPYRIRHRLLMKDGRIKYVEERCETTYDKYGEPLRSVGTIQDISPQIATDEQRRHLHNLFLRTETLAEIGSWEWNILTNEVYWSPEMYRQYGLDPSEHVKPDFQLAIASVHPSDRKALTKSIGDALSDQTNEILDLEYRICRPNGEIRFACSHGQIIRDTEGVPLFAYGVVRDITDVVRAETETKKSHQLLEAVFDTVHVCIAYLDRDMNFIRVNRPYANVENKEPEYFIGKNHFDLYPNEENFEIFVNAVKTGERVVFNAKAFESTNNPERGITHWDWTLTPVKDDSGYVTGLVLSLLDVSERVNAIENLKQNEIELKGLNENLENIVTRRTQELQEERNFIDTVLQIQGALTIVLDSNGCIVRFNRACEVVSGYSFTDVRGKPFWDFVIPDDEKPAVKTEFKNLINNGPVLPTRFENHWVNRNGSRRLIDWSNSTLSDNNGSVRYVIGTGIDVTERRQTEIQLRESETSLLRAQHIAKLGSWEWHVATGALWWSDEIYRIFGLNCKDIEPSYEMFFGMVHPEDVEAVKASEKRAMKYGQHDVIHRIILPDGEIRVVHELGEMQYDEVGKPMVMRGTVHDITEFKRAEDDRNQLQRQLEQAQKMESIGQLTGGIAHDFNNILSAIQGFTRLAITRYASDGNDTLRDYLSEIDKAGKRAEDLVKQMLAFSRGDNQQQVVLNPKYVIGESIQMLRSTIPSSIDISHDTLNDDVYIHTDALQLQQSIINLVINARDALGGKGNINVKVSQHKLPPLECTSCHKMFSGDFVSISISDNGNGIEKAVLARVFEPFFTTKEVGQGSGMGLAMVHGFVHASNGHLLVDSRVQQGTLIQMFFPVCELKNRYDTQDTIANGNDKITTPHQAKILVVDDEPTVIRLLSEVLHIYGYQVDSTTSSRNALKLLQLAPDGYDALITDQTMPELTGTELIKNVRQVNEQLPVILCSGYNDLVNDVNFADFGVTCYLEKPIDHEVLIQNLEALLNNG